MPMGRSSYLLLLCALGCSSVPPPEPDAGGEVFRIPVTIEGANGRVTIQAEVADTSEERSKGLMFREHLGENEGMIFLFPQEAQQSFWMRNTLIPLDMIFIRADRTILGIVENAEPRTDTPRSVPGKSQFVLEIAGGASRGLGLGPDQAVNFMAPLPNR